MTKKGDLLRGLLIYFWNGPLKVYTGSDRYSIYLRSIVFITPASIYTVYSSLIQLLFVQYSLRLSRFSLYSIHFSTPASI